MCVYIHIYIYLRYTLNKRYKNFESKGIEKICYINVQTKKQNKTNPQIVNVDTKQ